MSPQVLELRDAVLLAIDADPLHRRLRVRVDAYVADTEPGKRTHCVIAFDEVTRHVESIDWTELAQHAISGNIVYWTPAEHDGTTVFHFNQGYLSVTAGRVDVLVDA
ncbi:MAG: hypothetical protein ACREO3_09660 [Arenimonas sp.]